MASAFAPALRALALTVLLTAAAFAVAAASATTARAHQDGCHRWHSCPSDTGSYVCGDLGYSTYCGNPTAPPVAPVVTVPLPTTPTVWVPPPGPAVAPLPVVDTSVPECANNRDDDGDGRLDLDDNGCDIGEREACRLTPFVHVHRRVHRHAYGQRHTHRLRHTHYRVRCPTT